MELRVELRDLETFVVVAEELHVVPAAGLRFVESARAVLRAVDPPWAGS